MNEIFGWLTWVFPFIGAVSTPLLARVHPRVRDYGSVAFSFLAALSSAMLLPMLSSRSAEDLQVNWIQSLNLKAGILLDPLSVIMANVVSWVSFLIMVYSVSYMKGDEGLTRYWFFMNFFIGNMLLLVLSDNLFQFFFGWEGVGLCSYALIGHLYSDSPHDYVGVLGERTWNEPMAYSPSHAGMKALIVTRVGDIGLLIAIFMIYSYSGTLNFVDLSKNVAWALPLSRLGLLVPLAALFFFGPIGKSAQFPLHEWLPDAMTGPASVSALIHAATMVTAGVYLAARAGPIFYNIAINYHGTYFFDMVAWVGAFTALLGASQALVSKELKKLLAYSTISQIGYMMLGVGAGGLAAQFILGASAGIFHLMTHAFFKAAAFLAAGAILHAVDSRFMTDMGGLRRPMKITFISMTISMLALSGVPPLSGFWSKDDVMTVTVLSGQTPLLLLGWGTVALTVLYSLKAIGLIFLGSPSENVKKREKNGYHVHEAPSLMWVPYVVMAAVTVAIGLAGPYVQSFLSRSLSVTLTPLASQTPFLSSGIEEEASLDATLVSLLMLLVGGFIGYLTYIPGKVRASDLVGEKGPVRGLYNFFWNRWYINPFYYKVFGDGALYLAGGVRRWIEAAFFDRISGAVAGFSLKVSTGGHGVDTGVIDGAINRLAYIGSRFSSILRRLESGITQQYVAVFAVGLFILMLAVLFRIL